MEVAKIIEISQIKDLESGESTCDMTIQTSDKVAMYIFEKGYIAIDGISLTVGETHEGGVSGAYNPGNITKDDTRQQGSRVFGEYRNRLDHPSSC